MKLSGPRPAADDVDSHVVDHRLVLGRRDLQRQDAAPFGRQAGQVLSQTGGLQKVDQRILVGNDVGSGCVHRGVHVQSAL